MRRLIAGAVLALLFLGGCTSPPAGPVAVFSFVPQEGPPPLLVEFDASGSVGAVFYRWDFGDGDTGEGVTVSHLYQWAGEYRVVLRVRDEAGREDEATAWVRVYGRRPVAAFSCPSDVTQFQVVTFDASASYDPDGWIVEWNWDFGDGATASGEVVQHQYFFGLECGDDPVTVTVTLQVVDDEGNTSTTWREVTVWPRCHR